MTATTTAAGAALLDVRGINISFGGLKAVQNFSLQLPRGGLYGLAHCMFQISTATIRISKIPIATPRHDR